MNESIHPGEEGFFQMFVRSIMGSLAKKRPVFHSEKDFQFAFAWEIREQYPGSEPRLEYVIHEFGFHMDIWVKLNEHDPWIPIELKYKTKGSRFSIKDEVFILKNHGAQDLGRYDIIKDIERIEKIVDKRRCPGGITISLTNDNSYWAQSKSKRETIDQAFRLTEGVTLSGAMRWTEQASEGTTKNRKKPITLTYEYPLIWENFSSLIEETSGKLMNFRYLSTIRQ